MYLTTSDKIVPHERDTLGAKKGMSYQAWVESKDGGKTWSKPAPLFGTRLRDFPVIEASVTDATSAVKAEKLLAAGGTKGPGNHNQNLGWALPVGASDPSISGGVRLFIISGQTLLKPKGSGFPGDVGNEPNYNVGIVSFKDIGNLDAPWTHVVATDNQVLKLPDSTIQAWQHQYGALPGTSVRAVTYTERTKTGTGANESLVISISTDTGKHFNHFARFDAARLGIGKLDSSLVFVASPCLYRDAKGDILLM